MNNHAPTDRALLLGSAGTLSPLLCHHALDLGRNALDIVSFDTGILGASQNNLRIPMAGLPRCDWLKPVSSF